MSIARKFELLMQCQDVLAGLPIDSWEQASRAQKRSAGLTGRWAIEKAFAASIIARGESPASGQSLLELQAAANIGLLESHERLLAEVDETVNAQEPDETDDLYSHYLCAQLAGSIVATVRNQVMANDIMNRYR